MVSFHPDGTGAEGSGLGESWMWALSAWLRSSGLATYNRMMAMDQRHWKKEWLARLSRASVVVVMLTRKFVQSKNCIKEIESAVAMGRLIVPLKLEAVGLQGDFLGPGSQETTTANYIRSHLVSCTPPSPETFQGFGADDFKNNATELVSRIKDEMASHRDGESAADRRSSRKFSQAGRPPVRPPSSAKPARRSHPTPGAALEESIHQPRAPPPPPSSAKPAMRSHPTPGAALEESMIHQPRAPPPLPSAPPPSLQESSAPRRLAAAGAAAAAAVAAAATVAATAVPTATPDTALIEKDTEIARLKDELAVASAGRRRAHRTAWRRAAAATKLASPPPVPPAPPAPPVPPAAPPASCAEKLLAKGNRASAAPMGLLAALQQDNYILLKPAEDSSKVRGYPSYAACSDVGGGGGGGGGLMGEVANTLKLRRRGMARDSEKRTSSANGDGGKASDTQPSNPMFNMGTLERGLKPTEAARPVSELSDGGWTSDESDSGC